MNPNLRMEQRSLAVIRAVAADAGYLVDRPEVDEDSVDGVLRADFGRRPRIEFQAKSTSRDIRKGDSLHYPLPIKNYNELRLDECWLPRILIVVLMPSVTEPWLSQSEDKLCLDSSAYWLSLAGMPQVSNTSTVTVYVPTANGFDREQLDALMVRAEEGGPL
ncbi:MAG: DUF4365 domain-containing protein [Caldilineaceae bacterium SB0665_bin_21]|nr:DUF4365 domain-containing protein [Caldilineaceae bacterium SB0665_bin_21]